MLFNFRRKSVRPDVYGEILLDTRGEYGYSRIPQINHYFYLTAEALLEVNTDKTTPDATIFDDITDMTITGGNLRILDIEGTVKLISTRSLISKINNSESYSHMPTEFAEKVVAVWYLRHTCKKKDNSNLAAVEKMIKFIVKSKATFKSKEQLIKWAHTELLKDIFIKNKNVFIKNNNGLNYQQLAIRMYNDGIISNADIDSAGAYTIKSIVEKHIKEHPEYLGPTKTNTGVRVKVKVTTNGGGQNVVNKSQSPKPYQPSNQNKGSERPSLFTPIKNPRGDPYSR